jgi:rRNA-processing protein FCF1
MNLKFDKPPQEVLAQFKQLRKAMIDTSSIIYARKAGFFRILQANIELITIPEIKAEAGDDADGIETMHCKATSETVDQKLVDCALQNNLAVISEDKKILSKLKQTHLPYFNVLMMLNFLSYLEAIDGDQYSHYYTALRKIAWYSPKIWYYGSSVRSAIEQSQ